MSVITNSGEQFIRSTAVGHTLLGYPIIQSTNVTVDSMFLIDAADFIAASDDTPTFSVSDQAVLHMEDTIHWPSALRELHRP